MKMPNLNRNQSAPTPRSDRRRGGAALLVLASLLHAASGPSATSGDEAAGVALGRAYAPVLAASYADAWLAASATLENGGSVAQAQRVLQETWRATRTRAFRDQVQPSLSRVLPEGTEPADATQRARVATFWRAFARGLKAAR